jgi:predicted secreted protein with PEFG-CTERM motif
MNTHLSVFALFAIMIASIGMAPAFGQIVQPIVVTTDKTSYSEGESIMVTGEVSELLFGYAISIMTIAPNGNVVSIDQVMVGSDKTFSTELSAGGMLMKQSGEYTIQVLYGTENRTAETTFTFGGTSGSGPDGPLVAVSGTDFMVGYQITGGKLISITPDVDANSLIIAIDATDDGQLTITLPRELIDAKIGDSDDDYFVLVDGEEVDFDETTTSTDRTLTISFPAGAEEIEIIGTHVVPEFGAIAALILAVAIISIIAVSAKSRLSIMPRY